MLRNLRLILELLTQRERRRGALVLGMTIVMAMLETAGVASIMPFLSVLGNREVVQENAFLATLYDWGGFGSTDRFLFALGLASFALVIAGAGFRIVTQYALHRYAEMRRHSISSRLLETYLRQPYEFFLGRHSGDLAKGILSEVDQLVLNVFNPGLMAAAYSVVCVAIIALLVAVDPMLALVVASVIGGVYALIYLGVRGVLGRIGRDRATANRERFTAAGEALGGIKDVKLLGREQAYMGRFRGPSTRFASHQAWNKVLSQVPKFLMEGVAFGGIVALALFLMGTREGFGEALPILGLYAFAGYRLLPAAQNVYAGVTKVRFGLSAVEDIHQDLHDRQRLAEIRTSVAREDAVRPKDEIALDQVSFRYPGAAEPALQDVSLTVPVGSTVGIVGTTGAGKTTLVDLLLGLLWPGEGRILVDGAPVEEDMLRRWQAALGYVPQDIFLTDASVAENIALGISREKMDEEAVERAARMAQVHDFVTTELPQGYETVVGERGVRLSGGQRQRIGIARALYHDPSVLVFDEATSNLDPATEGAVMEAVGALHGQKTVVMIAHRLATVRPCGRIYLLNGGRVQAAGTYSDLMEGEPEMRRLAGAR